VKRGFLKQADFNMTVRLQDHIPARLDGLWENLAFFVEPTPSIFVVGLLTIAAFVDFLPAQAGKKRKVRWQALLIPLLFGLIVLGETYGKNVVHHPAPPFFMIKHPTTAFPQFYINEQYSYPSGHTARAAFLGLILLSIMGSNLTLSMKYFRKWAILIGGVTAYILIVAIGRIYLGQHWLSDTIGGFLLGAGMGLLPYCFL
jgi:membrane-associated phospholipid phosphatase